ncbi:MAG: hypothetical protein ABSH20_11480 [Tepidisphaeraceae bacterium]|jgi:uncharacterized DUF497 family protein
MAAFLGDEKNTSHIAEHGISRSVAEYVVTHARHPYPTKEGDGKWLVRGRAADGGLVQVVFVYAADAGGVDVARADLLNADEEDLLYVIHTMRLTPEQKHRERRKSR